LSLVETIRELLPELAGAGSSEAVFGRPSETGGVVLIPVARLTAGFLGLGAAGDRALGGGIHLEPVAMVVIRDREVSLLHFDGRRRRIGAAPGNGAAGPSSGPDLAAIGSALQTLSREVGRGVRAARRGKSGGRLPGDGLTAADGGRMLDVTEEHEEHQRPDYVTDRGHGEGQGEA